MPHRLFVKYVQNITFFYMQGNKFELQLHTTFVS